MISLTETKRRRKLLISWSETQRRRELLISWSEKIADILDGNTVWGGKMRIYWMETQRRKELLISWSEKIADILGGDTETEKIVDILDGDTETEKIVDILDGDTETERITNILVGNTVWGGKMRIYWMETQGWVQMLIPWAEAFILGGDTKVKKGVENGNGNLVKDWIEARDTYQRAEEKTYQPV